MTLVKTVELRVLTDAGDAQAKLDELAAKADKLDGNAVKMRFRLDDGAGKAQLDEIRAKADRLGFKDVSIKVRVDGAGRAIAELDAVKATADKAGGVGLLSRITGLFGGGANAVGGGFMTSPGGIAAIAGGVATLLPEVVAVASGFAAAGTGAAAFYALAHPAINNLQGDVQALDAANQRLGFAQQKALIDPSKANLSALKSAQEQYQAIYQQMGQDAGPAAAGVLKLHDAYVRLTNAFAPQAFRIFADGIKVISNLLPQALPFANAFANAMHPLLQQLATFTQSSGFAQWLGQFRSLVGPAVTAIGQGIGGVVNQIGKLLTTFSGKDVAHGINIAFDIVKGAIAGVRIAVEGLRAAWDRLSQNSTFKKIAADFAQTWDSISKTGQKKPDFSGLVNGIKLAVSTGISFLEGRLPPLIYGALSAASKWLQANAGPLLIPVGRALIQGLISGIESSIPSLLPVLGRVAQFIVEHKGPLDVDRRLLVPHGQAVMAGLMAGIDSQMPALGRQLAGVTEAIGARGGSGYGGGVGDHIELHFHGITTDQGTVRQLVQVLREYKRHGGGAALGIA